MLDLTKIRAQLPAAATQNRVDLDAFAAHLDIAGSDNAAATLGFLEGASVGRRLVIETDEIGRVNCQITSRFGDVLAEASGASLAGAIHELFAQNESFMDVLREQRVL